MDPNSAISNIQLIIPFLTLDKRYRLADTKYSILYYASRWIVIVKTQTVEC